MSSPSIGLTNLAKPYHVHYHLHRRTGRCGVCRSPHGPLESGPPRAGYSQRRKKKEKGEKEKEERKKKERRRKKRKGKKKREEREEDLRPIWTGYSVFRLCTSLYTRPFI